MVLGRWRDGRGGGGGGCRGEVCDSVMSQLSINSQTKPVNLQH